MNLYRSFGNLMEAWVTEGEQGSDSGWLGNNYEDSPRPSSNVGANLRTDSVDSGVETASSVTSLPPTPSSASTDITEIHTFTPDRKGDGLTSASTSQSPVLSSPVSPSSSSSLPYLHSSRVQQSTTASHFKEEQALKKTDNTKEPLTVEEVLRRRPRAFVPKRPTSELVRGQRSESFRPKRTVNPSFPMRQRSMSCIKSPAPTRSEDRGAEERKGLSPGLLYLEQVCQMLEEIARQQMHSRALQMEADALREHQDLEAAEVGQSDSKVAEEDIISCPTLEKTESAEHSSSEPQQRKDYPYRHFRQRSASDTNISTMHLKKVNANCRGQHLSRDYLLEKEEEDHEMQVSEKDEPTKTNRNWKIKFGSFTRESSLRDSKGQQMQSSERNSARRRLSQLFKRKTKTVPV